jgi:hypothetical protein
MNTLTVAPDGIVTGLYTETIPLAEIGSLHIERLTNIEFSDETQQWVVRDRAGRLLFANPSRAACLEWEHRHFNQ